MRVNAVVASLFLLLTLPLAASAYPPYGPAPAPGPALGVMVKEVSFPELARMGLDHGVRIVRVMPGGPAAQAGLQPGDLIQSLNGKPVYSARRLQWLVLQATPDAPVNLTYLRGDERVEVALSLDGTAPTPAPATPPAAVGDAFLGVHLQAMTPELREAFGAPDGQGVLIAKIVTDSPAERAGLRAGDIILGIDGTPVRGTDDVYRTLDDRAPGDAIELQLIRASKSLDLTATLSRREPAARQDWWGRDEPRRDMRDFLPPPEYWRELMDQMMRSLEEGMDDLRQKWPETQGQEVY